MPLHLQRWKKLPSRSSQLTKRHGAGFLASAVLTVLALCTPALPAYCLSERFSNWYRLVKLIRVQEQAGLRADAISTGYQALATAKAMGPDSPYIIVTLSELLRVEGNEDAVEKLLLQQELLEKSLSANFPGLYRIYIQRADLREAHRDWKEAAYWLERALVLAPGSMARGAYEARLAALFEIQGNSVRRQETIERWQTSCLQLRSQKRRFVELAKFVGIIQGYGMRIFGPPPLPLAAIAVRLRLCRLSEKVLQDASSWSLAGKERAQVNTLLRAVHATVVQTELNAVSVCFQCLQKSDYSVATPYLESIIALEARPVEARALALHYLGYYDYLQKRYDQADQRLSEAVSIRQRGTDPLLLISSLEVLATIRHVKNQPQDSERLYKEALAVRKKFKLSDEAAMAVDVVCVGLALTWQQNYRAAEPWLRKGLALLERGKGKNATYIDEGLKALATSYAMMHREADATKVWQQLYKRDPSCSAIPERIKGGSK